MLQHQTPSLNPVQVRIRSSGAKSSLTMKRRMRLKRMDKRGMLKGRMYRPLSVSIRLSAASARSSRARLLKPNHELSVCGKAKHRQTDLPAFFLNPVPISFFSSMAPSFNALPPEPNALVIVILEPALRFFPVWAPVCVEGPLNLIVLLRRW